MRHTIDHWTEMAEADKAIHEAIGRRLAVANMELRAALIRMMEYVPDCGFPRNARPAYCPEGADVEQYREETGLNSQPPFFTEGYLYELLGKEDARTILALMSRLAHAIGYESLDDLRRGQGPFLQRAMEDRRR